jgi:hypothetical protein
MPVDPDLPGAEIVERALEDLSRHKASSAAIALQVIAPRLRLIGYEVPALELDDWAEIELYRQLSNEGVLDPYSSYNAILRRLRSFAAAVESQYYRELRRRASR